MNPFEVPVTLTWESADCIDRLIYHFDNDDINVIVNFCIVFALKYFNKAPRKFAYDIYNDVKKSIDKYGTYYDSPVGINNQ